MKNIKFKVNQIIKKCETRDVYKILDYLNIKLFKLNFESEIGMYRFLKNNKVIILSENLDMYKERFILAHEIGHAVLHRKENCFYLKHHTDLKTNVYEIEANKFAAELLISDDDIKFCIENNYTDKQMANYFHVPIELINYKIKEMM